MVELPASLGPRSEGARLFAKLEAYNPGGSVKDRIGVAMIEAAEAEGRIEPGRTTIVEATSGNTGIALAFVCAAKGYDLVLTLPQGMSRERESLLRLYGARVDITESLGGMEEAVDAARALAGRDDVFLPDQFTNPANPEVHRRTTGPEIGAALDGERRRARRGRRHGRHDHGRRRAPARGRATRSCASSRSSRQGSAVLSGGRPARTGSRGSAPASCRPVLNRELLDEIIPVSDEDAIQTAWRCARQRGRAGRDLLRRGAVGRARGRRAPGVRGRSASSSSCRTPASATSPSRSLRRSPRRVSAIGSVARRSRPRASPPG